MSISKLFPLLGAINALLAIAFGAFGAHALKERLSVDLLAVFHTAAQYHFYHALGLVLVGLLAMHLPSTLWLKASGWLMLLGIVLFSGSLYALSLTGIRALGAITPLGGLSFMIAWALLAVAIVRSP